jgi:hypothetical protein
LVLYGEHTNGTDLTYDERAMLTKIADNAAVVLAKLETEALRRRVGELEHELELMKAVSNPA